MKLLFDATELSYYEENSTYRAGIFYVALNLFEQFKKMNVDITFHCDFKRYYFLKNISYFKEVPLLEENSFINKFISFILYKTRNFPHRIKYLFIVLARIYDKHFYLKNSKNIKQLQPYKIYFSPCTPPSREIADSKLIKFRMLHDAIPIVEMGGKSHAGDWYDKVYNTINSTDFYVTNSNYTKQDILKYFPFIDQEHIKTTLLGANSNFYPDKTKVPISGKYIFSLCSLGKRKNLEFAIRNFFNFIEKNNITDLKLVLGGGIWDKYKKSLENILSKYDKSKITITGYIKEEDLKYYYSNALMFIYPSLYEGFGLPVLEAMQCGCPVITSSTTSLPEVIGNAGIQIDPTSDEDMIQAYERMYYDNIFRALCSERSLERGAQFSWEKCACEILNFIKLNA